MKQFLIKNLLFSTMFLVACNFEQPKIEPGDVVTKCIIDSVWIVPPKSTLDFDLRYYYLTDCGNTLTTYNRQVYKIGDTITYVKKLKNN